MKSNLVYLLYCVALIVGAVMTAVCVICLVSLGVMQKTVSKPLTVPIVVEYPGNPSPGQEDALLEMHGLLKCDEVLEIPEYGISLKAGAVLVDARVACRDASHPSGMLLYPTEYAAPGAAAEAAQCPTRSLWAQTMRMGNYGVDSALLKSILRSRLPASVLCERCFLPLPVEEIKLPEPLQSMARVLPETVRAEHPDCTIIHLSARYRDPSVPVLPMQEGDIELCFSYLPAEFAASLRGHYSQGRITCRNVRDCCFAAEGTKLPSVKKSDPAISWLSSAMIHLWAQLYLFLLAGILLFRLSLRHLNGKSVPLRVIPSAVSAFALQLLAVIFGYFFSF